MIIQLKEGKVKDKDKTKKTKEAEEVIHKKNKVKQLNKKYASLKPLKYGVARIKIEELTYGIIESSDLVSVIVDGEEIPFDNSWIDFISLGIDTVREYSNDEMNELLSRLGVTSSEFSIDKSVTYRIPKYTETTYRVCSSELLMRSSFRPEVIYSVVAGLMKTRWLCKETIEFNLRNKKSDDEIMRETVVESTEIVKASDINKAFKEGKLIKSVGIHTENYNEDTSVTNIAVMLVAYVTQLYRGFGVIPLSRSDIECDTRIVEGTIEGGVAVGDSGYSVVSDCSIDSVTEFIMYTMMITGLREEEVEFRFKHEEYSGKEWEIT